MRVILLRSFPADSHRTNLSLRGVPVRLHLVETIDQAIDPRRVVEPGFTTPPLQFCQTVAESEPDFL